MAEQLDRPDKAQSCRRAIPPKVCVRNRPASIRSKIIASPMSAARRVVGGGSGSGSWGCQGSGFLMVAPFVKQMSRKAWYLRDARLKIHKRGKCVHKVWVP